MKTDKKVPFRVSGTVKLVIAVIGTILSVVFGIPLTLDS